MVLWTIQSLCGSQTNTHPPPFCSSREPCPLHFSYWRNNGHGSRSQAKIWDFNESRRWVLGETGSWNSDLLTHAKSFLSQATSCDTSHVQALREALSIRIPSPSRNGLHMPRAGKGSVVLAFRKQRKTGWVLSGRVHTNMKYMNWK